MIKTVFFVVFTLLLSVFATDMSLEGSMISGYGPIADQHAAVNLGPEVSSVPHSGSSPLMNCDISRDNCGVIGVGQALGWAGDGAYNSIEGTMFIVDVASVDAVYQVDPATCAFVSGSYGTTAAGISQRGCGYDSVNHEFWVGSWNYPETLYQHSAVFPYTLVSATAVPGVGIAGIAIDAANRLLFALTNANP